MDQQLSETLAAQIAAKHAEALEAAKHARVNIVAALDAAADVGLIIDDAKQIYKNRLNEWLRKYVPTLTPEQADKYHGIYKVKERRKINGGQGLDTRQLKLIDIIGDDDLADNGGTSKGQKADGTRWIKWTGHVVHYFRELDSTRPIERWEDYERKALADTLQPIVALFKRAGGIV